MREEEVNRELIENLHIGFGGELGLKDGFRREPFYWKFSSKIFRRPFVLGEAEVGQLNSKLITLNVIFYFKSKIKFIGICILSS